VNRISPLKQRLPCAGLFLCAVAGVVVGRYIPLPGWPFAVGAVIAIATAWRWRVAVFLGAALAFAAAETWEFRESPAVRLASHLSESWQTCEAEIEVLEAPHISPNFPQRCRFTAELATLRIAGVESHPDCRVMVTWNGAPPAYGSHYLARAAIRNCPPARNPGAFDYTVWLANAGIRTEMDILRLGDTRLLATGGNPIVHASIAACQWIEKTVSIGIDGTPEASLIRAMTVGDTSDAPDSIKDSFRETGTFHLFSVSGLHVGIVAIILWATLGACGVSPRRSVLIIIPALFFYALVTGLSAPSIRAAAMLSVIAAGLLLDRPPFPLNSVGAAGIVILALDPSQLFNSGFQLSFGAVVMILLFALPIQNRLGVVCQPDPFIPARLIPPALRFWQKLGGGGIALIAVSLAAWIASLPLIVFYFHLVSLSSIAANLIAVPLSGFLIELATVSLVAGIFSPWLAGIFNQANFLLARILLLVVQGFAAIPGSAIYVGPPQAPDTIVQIVVFDAGRGGSAAIFAGGRSWLVDTGPEFFADTTTLPFLRAAGVNRLSALVLTHGDTSHIGGFDAIAQALHPELILDSGLKDRSVDHSRILSALRQARAPLTLATAGASFALSSTARLTVIYPPPDVQGACADDKALVLRLDAGKFSALFMSDAGLPTEQWLLAHARAALPCDVVAMGRHASGFSGDPEFLRAASPRVVIASAASFPKTEQIPAQWAESVRAMGIDLVRQDESGAATVTAKADSFTVTPFLSSGGSSRTFPDGTHPLR